MLLKGTVSTVLNNNTNKCNPKKAGPFAKQKN